MTSPTVLGRPRPAGRAAPLGGRRSTPRSTRSTRSTCSRSPTAIRARTCWPRSRRRWARPRGSRRPSGRVPRVAAALSLGALMGARGNSGVILSQLFRGLGEAVSGRRVDRRRASWRDALEQGCAAAFAAVANPVEGTILTVARDAPTAAAQALAANGTGSGSTCSPRPSAAAAASVARTPDAAADPAPAPVSSTPAARASSCCCAARWPRSAASTCPRQLAAVDDIALPSLDALEAEGLRLRDGLRRHAARGRAARRRRRSGDARSSWASRCSSPVTADAVKIHIHNERPDEVLAYGLTLGSLSRINVENLDRQATHVRDRVQQATARNGAVRRRAQRRRTGGCHRRPGRRRRRAGRRLGASSRPSA